MPSCQLVYSKSKKPNNKETNITCFSRNQVYQLRKASIPGDATFHSVFCLAGVVTSIMFLNVKNVQLWDFAFSSLIGLGLIINDFQTILQPNNRGCGRSFDSTCKYHVFTRGGSEICRMAIEKDDSAFWRKNCFNFISRIPGGKGGGMGGGGYSQQFLNGEASPRGPTPYPF